MSRKRGIEVDRRVGIAMSVLTEAQQSAIRRTLSSVAAFEEKVDSAGKVQTLRTSGQPLYLLRVTPSLRLVYTEVEETIHVVDLVEQATLDRFAARRSKEMAGKSVAGHAVEKAGDFIDK